MTEFKYNGFVYQFNENFKDQKELLFIKGKDSYQSNDELYHYYALNTNGVNSLTKSYIYANHPYHFNDPYDCSRDLISYDNCKLEDVLELNDNFFESLFIKRLYESNDSADKVEMAKYLNFIIFNVVYLKVGIFCLTNNIESIEMWSYYSNHRGFTLNFDIDKIPQNFWGPFQINYTEDFKPIDYTIFKRASFIYQSNIKANCWKPENETRLIFFGPEKMKIPYRDTPNSHDRKFYYNPSSVKDIVLGQSFFEIHEYDFGKSTISRAFVTLKTKKKLKRKVLYYIIRNKIPVSMIGLKGSNEFKLKAFPFKLTQQTCNKYILDF